MKSKTRSDTGHIVASAEAEQHTNGDISLRMHLEDVIVTTINGADAILVGVAPSGFTAILCPEGWRRLQQWKLTRFRITRGMLYAAGEGRAGGFAAARFLLNASGNHIIRHRNGNPFDIRLSNIVPIPRGLLKQAKIEAARGPSYKNPDVRWGNGRRHAGKPLSSPSAQQRVKDAMT